MRIIKETRLAEWAVDYPDAQTWLLKWREVVRKAQWVSIADVRRTFPHADPVQVASGRSVCVLNACGNKYRLVTAIHYNRGIVYVLRFMTHAQYSKNRWKASL